MRIALLTTDNREHFKDYESMVPCFGTAPEALLQGLAGFPGVEVHVVSCLQKPVKSPEKLAPNIWYHALHVSKIGWMRTLYQGCIRAVRRKLRSIGPDLVHGQGTERDNALAAVFSGFPNVLTIHGNMRLVAGVIGARRLSFHGLASRLEAFTIPRSAGVVCITNYTREAVASLARKTWVVPNAVDAGFFAVEPAAAPSPVPVVLCVGAVCLRKNQNLFMRALDPLARERPFRVVFLGQADRGEPYAREFFELLAARPWCAHEGFAGRELLKNHLSHASLLALPSLEDNCPMTVLEAMAAGVPVVAANVGGVPDLIEEGATGLFCDPTDPASVRAAVSRMLVEPGLGRALAAQAKERAKERFHPSVIARRHVEIYREVLSSEALRRS